MQADFERAAQFADAADEHLNEADRWDSSAAFADDPEVAAQWRTYALYRRVQAGECRALEKLALRGDAC